MQLYQGLADDWKKNIFPYIHGSITLDIKNLGDAYNFPFWAVTSADLNRVRITKDGDLILAYYIGLVNPPYEYISFNFDYSNVLVRMNMRDNPGLTEWAKSILYKLKKDNILSIVWNSCNCWLYLDYICNLS